MSEPQVETLVDVKEKFPSCPEEIQVLPETPTARDLEGYISHWLSTAQKEKIRDLALVAKGLGDDFPLEKTAYGSAVYRHVKRLVVGEYSLYYYRLKSYQDYLCEIEMFVLRVLRDEGKENEFTQVNLSYTIVRNPETNRIETERLASAIDAPIYIPGAWEDLFLLSKQQAIYKLQDAKRIRTQRERAQLLRRIGLGE